MFHNVGKIDRIIRVVLAVILATLYFTKVVEGSWGTGIIIAAVVLLMTSLRQCCPIYALLGFGTCGIDPGKTDKTIKTEKLKL
ncbi:MAG: DUF2892 domain-containing protein [Bacteroidota bacterium]|nr:DUF2892 domain-containing protein [Odoribacter sp.]MDP3642351.1 DUF2892 domain-containing protein [Bacteroidota bacterium]